MEICATQLANLCGQARTGCGAAMLRHFSPTGYTSTFTSLHIDSFLAGGRYGFYQYGARDLYVKITLPSPGNSNDVGFLADDLKLFCQVLLQ